MWNRDQQQKSTSNANPLPIQPPASATAAMPLPPVAAPTKSPEPAATASVAATVPPRPGASLHIKGEISANEDLVFHGRIEGKVSLTGHMLTIGPQAKISAEIVAGTLIIAGSVTGNVAATERFEIKAGGQMKGNVTCPNVVMSEGSEFTGGVDMRRKPGTS